MTSNQVAYAGVMVQQDRLKLDEKGLEETNRHNVALENLSQQSNDITREYQNRRNDIEQMKAENERWYKEQTVLLAYDSNALTRARDQFTYEVNRFNAETNRLDAQTREQLKEIEKLKATEIERHNKEVEEYNRGMLQNDTYAKETQRLATNYERLSALESNYINVMNASTNALRAETEQNRLTFDKEMFEFNKTVKTSSEIREWMNAADASARGWVSTIIGKGGVGSIIPLLF